MRKKQRSLACMAWHALAVATSLAAAVTIINLPPKSLLIWAMLCGAWFLMYRLGGKLFQPFADTANGSCVRDAFRQAGIDLDIADSPSFADLIELCESLDFGIQVLDGECELEEDESVIVLTVRGDGHAAYFETPDKIRLAKGDEGAGIIFLERPFDKDNVISWKPSND